MAQFRAVIKGQRGSASRLGSKVSGIIAAVNGWNGGVLVNAFHSDRDGDIFKVYATAGSNGNSFDEYLGYVGNNGIFYPNNAR